MAQFLLSLAAVSISVTLLALPLWLWRKKLVTRYRPGTCYALWALLMVALLLPVRPQVLGVRIQISEQPYEVRQQAAVRTPEMIVAEEALDITEQTQGRQVEPDMEAAHTESTPEMLGTNPLPETPWSDLPSPGLAISSLEIIFVLWLTGAVLVLCWQLWRHARWLRLMRRWQEPVDTGEDLEAVQRACAVVGLTPSQVRVARVPFISSPMVTGILRPWLLLPDYPFGQEELQLILCHELWHVKRRDLVYKMLACLACAFHWFNPMAWLYARELGIMCEMSCDARVLRGRNVQMRDTYRATILRALCAQSKMSGPLTSQFAGGIKNMKHRITLLEDTGFKRLGAGFVTLMLALVLCTGGVLAVVGGESLITVDEELGMYIPGVLTLAEHEYLMGFATPGYEALTVDAYAEQVRPHLPQIEAIFESKSPENRFMNHLLFTVKDILKTNHNNDGYFLPCNAMMWRTGGAEGAYGAYLHYNLTWKIDEGSDITVGERNAVLDEAWARAQRWLMGKDQEFLRALDAWRVTQDALDQISAELSTESMEILLNLTGMDVDEEEEFVPFSEPALAMLDDVCAPGYEQLTVREITEKVKTYPQQVIDEIVNTYATGPRNESVRYSIGDAKATDGRTICYWGRSLFTDRMPTPPVRGSVLLGLTLTYTVKDPDQVTVGQRDEILRTLDQRIIDLTDGFVWDSGALDEEEDAWELAAAYFAQKVPAVAKALSSDTLEIEISDVRLESAPHWTREEAAASPRKALHTFLRCWIRDDAVGMKDFVLPQWREEKNRSIQGIFEDLNALWKNGNKLFDWEVAGETEADAQEAHLNMTLKRRGESEAESYTVRMVCQEGLWYVDPDSLGIGKATE